MEVPEGSPEERSMCLARTLNTLQKSGTLCDVQIKVGQRSFACHRCALAVSAYCAAMFMGELRESTESEVPIEEVEGVPMQPETFEQILQYIYGLSDFQLNDQNAWQLLFAVNRFQVSIIANHHILSVCQTEAALRF